MKRLFAVIVETEIMVLAEDRGAAGRLAIQTLDGIGEIDVHRIIPVEDFGDIPSGWNESDVPFGDDERTVGQFLVEVKTSSQNWPLTGPSSHCGYCNAGPSRAPGHVTGTCPAAT